MLRVVVVLWCLCSLSMAIAGERRVAFVIGNSGYQNISKLDNPGNDADDVASRLQNLGFKLHGDKVHKDLTRRQLQVQIKEFAKVAENKEIAFFYFAGHGMQFKGDPHLLPVDIPNLKYLDIVKSEAISLNTLLYTLNQTAEVTIAVFDACRNIPDYEDQIGRAVLGGSRAEWRGLSPPQAKVNSTLIAYSGGSGEIVKDGKGQRNSPYTQLLLKELTVEKLKEKQLDIRGTFDEVSHQFRLKHQGGQQPEVISRGVPPGHYYLYEAIAEKIEIAKTNTDRERQTENLYWESVILGKTVAEYQSYLKKYPEGEFKGLAEARIESLQSDNLPIAEQQPPVPDPVVRTGRLSVKVEPLNARVRIMNIVPRYRDGMKLELNQEYDILVTKSGFKPWRRTVRLADKKQDVKVVLQKRSVAPSSSKEIIDKPIVPEVVFDAQESSPEDTVAKSAQSNKATTPVENTDIAPMSPITKKMIVELISGACLYRVGKEHICLRPQKHTNSNAFGPVEVGSFDKYTNGQSGITVKGRIDEDFCYADKCFPISQFSIKTLTSYLSEQEVKTTPVGAIAKEEPLSIDPASNEGGTFDGDWVGVVSHTRKEVQLGPIKDVFGDEVFVFESCEDLTGTEYPFAVQNNAISVLVSEPVIGTNGKFTVVSNSKTLNGSLRTMTGHLKNNKDHGCTSHLTYHKQQALTFNSVNSEFSDFDGDWIAVVDRTEKDLELEIPHPENEGEMIAISFDCQDLGGEEYPFVVKNNRVSMLLGEPVEDSSGKFRFTQNGKTLTGSLRTTTGHLTNKEDLRGCISTLTYRRR